jgi:hypothetical protein
VERLYVAVNAKGEEFCSSMSLPMVLVVAILKTNVLLALVLEG